MSGSRSVLSTRAAELRLAFDRSFMTMPTGATDQDEDLLGIRLGASPHAIRLSEIAGLFVDKVVTPVPTSAAALLGIAGFRGTILPVYGLQALLGQSTVETPRWLTIASGAPIALGFDGFDGHLRVSRDEILRRDGEESRSKFIREFVRANEIIRPILHLPTVLDAIRAQSQRPAQ